MSAPARSRSKVTSSSGIQFHKLNARQWEGRDAYHWLLTLRWPQFSAFVFLIYLGINVLFSFCYYLRPHSFEGADPASWADSFFFSVETLATVGYGHAYPASLYGHVVSTVEIMVGMFGMAIITGLIFIRFSRPTARIIFSQNLILAPFDGQPCLIFRVANLRDQAMVEAEFRIMMMRDEPTKEGESFRRFYPLTLQFDRLILFPAIITIRHLIDERSPLYGQSLADLERGDTRFTASIVCIDTVIHASIQSHHTYTWKDLLVNHRFVEVYTEIHDHAMAVDYGRIHGTEPVTEDASDGS